MIIISSVEEILIWFRHRNSPPFLSCKQNSVKMFFSIRKNKISSKIFLVGLLSKLRLFNDQAFIGETRNRYYHLLDKIGRYSVWRIAMTITTSYWTRINSIQEGKLFARWYCSFTSAFGCVTFYIHHWHNI